MSEPGGGGAAPPRTQPVSAVRPFLLTEGRVVAGEQALPMETQLVATEEALDRLTEPHLAFERRAIIEACRAPVSLAELAARLGLHLNVVRVLVGDLHTRQLLTVHVPARAGSSDLDILRRVIDGLRAIHTSGGPGHG
ncbi:MAG: DUF742 domain-containing protein [Catenulispora sp.]